MRISVIILFVFISFFAKGQFLDTLKVFLKSRPSIDVRLESRYSFMNNSPTKVSGFRLGLSFRRKLRVGIGYSWLNTPVYDKEMIIDELGKPKVTTNFFKFSYVCYYADFVFHKTKHWQLSVPIQVGTGAYWIESQDGIKTVKSQKRLLLFYEPGITVQYKITQWLGIGVDVCARLALRNTNYVGNKLNSFVFGFRYSIWFDQIFYKAFPKSKITKKYGPAMW